MKGLCQYMCKVTDAKTYMVDAIRTDVKIVQTIHDNWSKDVYIESAIIIMITEVKI